MKKEKSEIWLEDNAPVLFVVDKCHSCGSKLSVICPRCNNRSCTGGYGEDGKCPICPIAYSLFYAMYGAAKAMNATGSAEMTRLSKSESDE